MAPPSESHRLLSRYSSCDPGTSGCPPPTPGSKILQSFCATVWLIQPGSASQNLSVQLWFQTELLLAGKTFGFYGDFGSDRERAIPNMQGISQKVLLVSPFKGLPKSTPICAASGVCKKKGLTELDGRGHQGDCRPRPLKETWRRKICCASTWHYRLRG